MADVGDQDSEALDAAVTRLDRLRLAALEDRFDAEVDLGHGAELVAELTDLVAAHPVRERLVAALMRALAAAGRDTEALFAYERTREALADLLGVDPSPESLRRARRAAAGRAGTAGGEPETNVRAELTSFVGRDADVAAVRELIGEHRLTTLIGPGGSGKTRLATETARTLLDGLPDGVRLVELAAIGAGGDVAQAALAGLGLRDALLGSSPSADPVDGFVAAIRDREALLILDNCEHVIESAAAFADRVLGECRRCGSWLPAGNRSASPVRRSGRWNRWPCPTLGPAPAPPTSNPHPPSGCCATGRARYSRTSAATPAPCRRWRASAGRWTGCRSRSNWPRPGCAR